MLPPAPHGSCATCRRATRLASGVGLRPCRGVTGSGIAPNGRAHRGAGDAAIESGGVSIVRSSGARTSTLSRGSWRTAPSVLRHGFGAPRRARSLLAYHRVRDAARGSALRRTRGRDGAGARRRRRGAHRRCRPSVSGLSRRRRLPDPPAERGRARRRASRQRSHRGGGRRLPPRLARARTVGDGTRHLRGGARGGPLHRARGARALHMAGAPPRLRRLLRGLRAHARHRARRLSPEPRRPPQPLLPRLHVPLGGVERGRPRRDPRLHQGRRVRGRVPRRVPARARLGVLPDLSREPVPRGVARLARPVPSTLSLRHRGRSGLHRDLFRRLPAGPRVDRPRLALPDRARVPVRARQHLVPHQGRRPAGTRGGAPPRRSSISRPPCCSSASRWAWAAGRSSCLPRSPTSTRRPSPPRWAPPSCSSIPPPSPTPPCATASSTPPW